MCWRTTKKAMCTLILWPRLNNQPVRMDSRSPAPVFGCAAEAMARHDGDVSLDCAVVCVLLYEPTVLARHRKLWCSNVNAAVLFHMHRKGVTLLWVSCH